MELLVNITPLWFKREVINFVHHLSDNFALGEPGWSNKLNAVELAGKLANSSIDKTQLRAILNIAQSTGSVADILDAIKMRTGRDTQKKGWALYKNGSIVVNLLTNLRDTVDQFLEKFPDEKKENPGVARLIHLQLCRTYLKHTVAHFEYIKHTRAGND